MVPRCGNSQIDMVVRLHYNSTEHVLNFGGVIILNKTVLAVLAVVLVVVFAVFSGYNSLVTMNENVNGKWSQVENQLQRRSDLIPNLVAPVQGMAKQEKEVIQSVTDARAKLAGAQSVPQKASADNELTSALSRLLVVVENYPVIKSDASFRQLSDELAGTENRIAVARKDYNDAVQTYNSSIKSLPTALYAGMLGFSEKEYFKVEESAKAVPKVSF